VVCVNISEFVTKVANPYFALHENVSNVTNEFLRSSVEFAVKNKVFPLFYEGCLKLGIRLPREAELLAGSYEKRRKMQLEEVNLLLDISDKLGIELMFFKTFRPFNYIPDDIDVLLRDEKDLGPLVDKLKEKGYFILKVGTPEVVLRKVGKDVYVDLDIHKRLAVGHLDVFRVENLWRNHAYETIRINNGCKMLKLSDDYEVVREAAYSLLKDFNLSIPGLYLAIYSMMNSDLKVLERIAEEENLLLPLDLYLNVAHYIACKLFGSEARFQLPKAKGKAAPGILLKLCKRQQLRMPYYYPILAITWAYMSKVELEIRRNRNVGVLLQLIKQPSSKGMGILLDYIRECFH